LKDDPNKELLFNFLASFGILTESEIDEFVQLTTRKHLDKSDYFIREGETCKYVAFVLSGILRSYYRSDKGEEITYCITFPENLMTAYSSFLTSKPTQENIQAITPMELLIISKEKVENLASKSTNWMFFLKVIAEQQYIELEKRTFRLQGRNVKNRYSDLMQNQPEYLKAVPLHYLASYLGVSQRHLSRIRKEISL
jgi:CRP-like cAMP-binding protein